MIVKRLNAEQIFSTDRVLGFGLLFLYIYIVWARSGIVGPLHEPVWWMLAGFMLLFFAAKLMEVRRGSNFGIMSLLRDPLFYVGALLVILVLLQWWNSGRVGVLNFLTGQMVYADPPHPKWPSSINPYYSRHMLVWFVPLWLMLLAVRHGLSRAMTKVVLWSMLLNGGISALFGLVQYALGLRKMFGVVQIPGGGHFIATFGYSNHGGQFFYLFYALALGLLWDAVEKKKSLRLRIIYGFFALLFVAAAFASLSRFAVLAVGVISVSFFVAWIGMHWKDISVGQYVNLGLGAIVVLVGLIYLLYAFGKGAVAKEFAGTSVVEKDVLGYYEARGFQIPPAIEMWKTSPWFGVGGWGYPYLVKNYLDRDYHAKLGQGKANVHCDPVQFLAEHGIIGSALLLLGMLILFADWRGVLKWRYKGLAWMGMSGVGLVLLHSLVDLPFRCPAVLWSWGLILVIIPKLNRRFIRSPREVA